MVHAFTLRSAHLHGNALAEQAALRHRVFVEQRGLDHTSVDGLEYDAFDTPAATYLVWRDAQGVVRGLVRLLPTTLPYMLEQYWTFLVADGALPKSQDVWEITRVCVDRTVHPRHRRRILPELLCATQDWLRDHGVTTMIGVTRRHLLSHFVRTDVTWLGDDALIEGQMEAAFSVPTAAIRPVAHCTQLGIHGRVLRTRPSARRAA
ncbi:MAG: acyl-homoserine-lactone synthase [Pseudomonadota bacterium]